MRAKKLKISICVVTYNQERYIEDCLASVIAQEVDAELEILVGDDCSVDNTRQIISRFAMRYPELVKPIYHEKNIGPSHNYQCLIKQGDGDFIAHLDGDDFWLPGKLAAQVAFLEKNLQCAAVYANALVINDSGDMLGRFNGLLAEEFTIEDLLRKGNFLNFSSLLYRSACKYKLLDFVGEALDFQYHLTLASQGHLGFINRALVIYRKGSAGSMVSSNVQIVLARYWQAIVFATTLTADDESIEKCASRFYRDLIFSALVRGRPMAIKGWGARMIRDCPSVTNFTLLKAWLQVPAAFGAEILRALGTVLLKGSVKTLHDR